jgi:hypothetical protein
VWVNKHGVDGEFLELGSSVRYSIRKGGEKTDRGVTFRVGKREGEK